MSNLYLIGGFNNYYNRRVKKFDTLQEYLQNHVYTELTATNFRYGDGVNTNHTFNYKNGLSFVPDYCIVVDNGTIESRWFIIEFEKNRGGQYSAKLYRDVVADNLQDILNAPAFIEKGTVNADDVAIFNSEDMTFNQIKTKETLLKDRTGCPWLVGYYSKKGQTEGSTSELQGEVLTRVKVDITENANKPISEWKYAKYQYEDYIGEPTYQETRFKLYAPQRGTLSNYETGEYKIFNHTYSSVVYPSKKQGFSHTLLRTNQLEEIATYTTVLNLAMKTVIPWNDDLQEFLQLDGKTISSTEEGGVKRVFKIDIRKRPNKVKITKVAAKNGSYYNKVRDTIVAAAGPMSSDQVIGDAVEAYLEAVGYTIVFTDITESIKYHITTNRYQCVDAPYDLFAIPYGNIAVNVSGTTFTTDGEVSMAVANDILTKYGGNSGFVYDVQLLPYCPIQAIVGADGSILTSDALQYSLVADTNNNNKTIILNPSYSKFSFNINLAEPIVINDPKIQNECDKYRLVSPNYNGQFEFSAAKNGGIAYFNVDNTYKPYSPYIHVNPNFDKLYGSDFDCARGLICGGDFSLSAVNDKFAAYELNNKNYLNSFNRQIENMEINNQYQKTADIINAIGGAFGSGAMAGGAASMLPGIGGIAATGIGAAAGGLSLAAGIADVAIKDDLRNIAIDYTKDQFGYSLGNIKALPYSLNRVSSITANNKLFPFLEYYTCSNEEKEALRNKIKYNGMTVMRIGKIKDFIKGSNCYVKAKLIVLENLADDYHTANTIAEEIYKGVRLDEYTR